MEFRRVLKTRQRSRILPVVAFSVALPQCPKTSQIYTVIIRLVVGSDDLWNVCLLPGDE